MSKGPMKTSSIIGKLSQALFFLLSSSRASYKMPCSRRLTHKAPVMHAKGNLAIPLCYSNLEKTGIVMKGWPVGANVMAFFEVACKSVGTEWCRIPINYFDCHWLTFDHVAWWVVFQFSVGLLVVRTSAWEATIRFTDRYVFVIPFFRCRLFNNNAKGL